MKRSSIGTRKIRGGNKNDVLPSVDYIIKCNTDTTICKELDNNLVTISIFNPAIHDGKVGLTRKVMSDFKDALENIKKTHKSKKTHAFVKSIIDDLGSKFSELSELTATMVSDDDSLNSSDSLTFTEDSSKGENPGVIVSDDDSLNSTGSLGKLTVTQDSSKVKNPSTRVSDGDKSVKYIAVNDDKLKLILDTLQDEKSYLSLMHAPFLQVLNDTYQSYDGLDISLIIPADFNSRISKHKDYNQLDLLTTKLNNSKLTYYELAEYWYHVYIQDDDLFDPTSITARKRNAMLKGEIAQVVRMLRSIGFTERFKPISNYKIKSNGITHDKKILSTIEKKVKFILTHHMDDKIRETHDLLLQRIGMYKHEINKTRKGGRKIQKLTTTRKNKR